MNDQPETVQRWRCRRCKRVWTREECSTRRGQIECAPCLGAAYVGLLEREPEKNEETAP